MAALSDSAVDITDVQTQLTRLETLIYGVHSMLSFMTIGAQAMLDRDIIASSAPSLNAPGHSVSKNNIPSSSKLRRQRAKQTRHRLWLESRSSQETSSTVMTQGPAADHSCNIVHAAVGTEVSSLDEELIKVSEVQELLEAKLEAQHQKHEASTRNLLQELTDSFAERRQVLEREVESSDLCSPELSSSAHVVDEIDETSTDFLSACSDTDKEAWRLIEEQLQTCLKSLRGSFHSTYDKLLDEEKEACGDQSIRIISAEAKAKASQDIVSFAKDAIKGSLEARGNLRLKEYMDHFAPQVQTTLVRGVAKIFRFVELDRSSQDGSNATFYHDQHFASISRRGMAQARNRKKR